MDCCYKLVQRLADIGQLALGLFGFMKTMIIGRFIMPLAWIPTDTLYYFFLFHIVTLTYWL